MQIVRLMCTGRIDLAFILRAFQRGASGVFIGGCWPGECHYIIEGNYDALGNMHIFRKLMEYVGLNPERLRVEWVSAGEGIRFAGVVNDFVKNLKKLGPLSNDGKAGPYGLQFKLEAAGRLISYLKLVEREKLRVPHKSEEAYKALYAAEDVNRLLHEVIADKLAIAQILLLLKERSLPTGEISKLLDMKSSEVSRHLNTLSKQEWVKYDVERKCYALA
jgi:coenzyme F420-reducing hydrogenase delta subunit